MDDKTLAKVITIALKSLFYSSESISIINKNNSYVESLFLFVIKKVWKYDLHQYADFTNSKKNS